MAESANDEVDSNTLALLVRSTYAGIQPIRGCYCAPRFSGFCSWQHVQKPINGEYERCLVLAARFLHIF